MEVRRLAAIMFTDIVGYTALMGSDEKKAFEVLRTNRNIQKPLIKKFRGKWLKEMGDGILASFDTATYAVRCAGEIQAQAKNQGIELRIGIHTGEVVFEGNDVLGDGVNVASRLEELTEAGSIYVSGAVYKDIKNKEGIITEFIEEKTLKNVDEPVKVYRVECDEVEVEPITEEKQKTSSTKVLYYILAGLIIIIVGGLIWYKIPNKPVGEIEKSIAVLPFYDDSPNKDNEYFCNGMLEELLDRLQKINELKVKSRSSVEKYRSTDRDIYIIRNELDVGYLVEGSVRKSGDDLRITAQLIDANTGDHLWSEVYDGKYTEQIFEFQSDLAKKIASSLNAIITPKEEKRIEQKPTTNMAAYDLQLKGNASIQNYYFTFDTLDLNRAYNLFDQAQKIDPDNVIGLGGKGRVHELKGNYDSALYYFDLLIEKRSEEPGGYHAKGFLLGTHMGQADEGIKLLRKAIQLNPNNPWILLGMGQIYLYGKEDYVTALKYFQKALEAGQDSNHPIYNNIGIAFLSLAEYSKAEKYFRLALKYADNTTQECIYSRVISNIFNLQGEFNKAEHFLDSICFIMNCKSECNRGKFYILFNQKDFEGANEIYNKLIESENTFDVGDSVTIAYIFKKLNKENESNEILKRCEKSIENRLVNNPSLPRKAWLYMNLSSINLILNEKEEALSFLTEAVRCYSNIILGLEVVPEFEELQDQPEFKALLKQVQDEKAALRVQVKEMEEQGELDL